MPAHVKLDQRREKRLLVIVSHGESVAAAARAIGISKQAISQRAKRDPRFAERLRLARADGHGSTPLIDDWRVAAVQLEAEHPDRWAIPLLDDDEIVFEP